MNIEYKVCLNTNSYDITETSLCEFVSCQADYL